MVVTCSALKKAYRDRLRAGDPELLFVFLDGGQELLQARRVLCSEEAAVYLKLTQRGGREHGDQQVFRLGARMHRGP
jgi:hypothetical protein